MVRLLALAIFALSAWRAAHLSITIDEAFTYNRFASGGFAGVFLSGFDANNHVLHSALAALSVHLFGVSELALRLPALAGAFLFLWVLPSLVRRLLPAAVWQQLLAMFVLACNPLTLDLLCLARGYSLALGFFALALDRLFAYADTEQRRDLLWMSVALGLSVASNLTFGYVALATMIAGCAVAAHRGRLPDAWAAVWPALLVCSYVLMLPLSRAEGGSFYFGATTVRSSAETTTDAFLLHDPEDLGPLGGARMRARFARRFLPIAAIALGLVLLTWFLSGRHRDVTLLGGIVYCALGGYWIAHVWLHSPYPSERTGLGLVFVFFLCLAAAAARLRTLGIPVAIVFAALALQFAMTMDPRFVWAWYDERDNRAMADFLERGGFRRVSSHWLFQPALEFYRASGRLRSLEPVVTQLSPTPTLQNHDAYVLLKTDAPTLEKNQLEVVWRSAARNVFVAVPAQKR